MILFEGQLIFSDELFMVKLFARRPGEYFYRMIIDDLRAYLENFDGIWFAEGVRNDLSIYRAAYTGNQYDGIIFIIVRHIIHLIT